MRSLPAVTLGKNDEKTETKTSLLYSLTHY